MTERLSPSALVAVWEQGVSATPRERALLILSAASPHESRDALARLSIGERDRWLLRLREETFGSQIQAVCDCPHCREPAELTFDVADVLVAHPALLNESLHLTQDGYDIRFRLPDSSDLAALSVNGDKDITAGQLLEKCLIEVKRGDDYILSEHLPPAIADAVSDRIAQADSQADIEFDITCPACGHSWTALFDIASFFWSELAARAQRLLRDVHTLAFAYGWSEESILGLSAARRQAYLEMVSG